MRSVRKHMSNQITPHEENLVGLGRFELPTSPLSGVRSNQLSYRPNRLGQPVTHWPGYSPFRLYVRNQVIRVSA